MIAAQLKSFDSLVVMGKIHKLGTEPVELRARVALASCLLMQAPSEILLFSAGGPYLHDTDVPVAQIVKEWAIEWGVDEGRVVISSKSNNTIREVKVIRDLLLKHKRKMPLIISHGYHLGRTQAYFKEIGCQVQVMPCSVKQVDHFLPHCPPEMRGVIADGQLSVFNALKEFFIEIVLRSIHLINPSGRLECWLADGVRDGNI